MNETLSIAHMKQSRIRNCFLKNRFQANKTAYLYLYYKKQNLTTKEIISEKDTGDEKEIGKL